jgi:hypothetical protein
LFHWTVLTTKYTIPRVPPCLSPRQNRDSPTPFLASECVPTPDPKGGWGGERGCGGVPIRTTGEKSIALCILYGLHNNILNTASFAVSLIQLCGRMLGYGLLYCSVFIGTQKLFEQRNYLESNIRLTSLWNYLAEVFGDTFILHSIVCDAVRRSGAHVDQYLDTLFMCVYGFQGLMHAQILFLSPQSTNPQILGLYPLYRKSVTFIRCASPRKSTMIY